MIIKFKKETSELNDYETESLFPIVVSTLSKAIGKENSVKSGAIIFEIKALGFKTDSPRIRKIIHEIRAKGLIKNLIATSKGYYITEDLKELSIYIQSLRQREDSIREIRASLIKQAKELC